MYQSLIERSIMKRIIVAVLLTVVVIAGCSCQIGSKANHDDNLIGQWKSSKRTMTMLRDGRFAFNFEYIGIWETDSDKEQITITHYDPFKEDILFSYRIYDSKLIIKSIDDKWGDDDEVFIRIKQTKSFSESGG